MPCHIYCIRLMADDGTFSSAERGMVGGGYKQKDNE